MKWFLLVVGLLILAGVFKVYGSGFSTGFKLGGATAIIPVIIIIIIAVIVFMVMRNRRP